MKLNLGCGSQVIDGWINVDYAIGARLAKAPFFRALNRKFKLFDLDWDERVYIYDLTRRFPWQNNTIDVVYSSHALEHLARETGRRFLEECHRVLRKGGIIRIVVPDLANIVREYSEGKFPSNQFVEKLGVLYSDSKNSIKNRLSPFIHFPHKCLYDTPTILTILSDIGFDARSRKPFDSDIEGIRHLELECRTEHAVIVEGNKF